MDVETGACPEMSTIVRTWTAVDACENSVSADQTIILQSGPVEYLATGDVEGSAAVSGNYINTHDSDNVYQVLTELESKGKPGNRYSYLEHQWVFDVVGGESITLFVEAHHSSNGEGDDFVFGYSEDGINFIDVMAVTKTADDDNPQAVALPSTLNGPVYLRVVDTDATPGNNALDSLLVDEMFIRVEGGGDLPPGQASHPLPADGEANVAVDTLLNWTAGVGGTLSEVYFGTSPALGTEAFQDAQAGTSFDPGLLAHDTTYYWRIDTVNANGRTPGPTWSFTTVSSGGCSGSDIHVDAMTLGAVLERRKWVGEATVRVTDDCGTPVSGATVVTSFTGSFNETTTGVTGADGTAVMTTAKFVRDIPAFTVCVDEVTHGLPYDPADNLITCDSY
jgi:hypothetical protein